MLTAKDLIDKYNSGSRDFRGLVLKPNENLSYAILKDADFRRANFTSINFTGADLSGANFSEGTCFSLSNLSNSNFTGANLTGTNLEDSILSNVILSHAIFGQDTRFPIGFSPFGGHSPLSEIQTSEKISVVKNQSHGIDIEAIENAIFQKAKRYFDEILFSYSTSNNDILDTLKLELESSNKKICKIEKEIEFLTKKYKDVTASFKDRTIKKLEKLSTSLIDDSSKHYQHSLAIIYNSNIKKLRSRAIGVSLTTESLKRILDDNSPNLVVLSRNSKPNYWIIDDPLEIFWLFPIEDWKPSIENVSSLTTLFNITGNPSQEFKLLRPAKVSAIGKNWCLLEPGEIKF